MRRRATDYKNRFAHVRPEDDSGGWPNGMTVPELGEAGAILTAELVRIHSENQAQGRSWDSLQGKTATPQGLMVLGAYAQILEDLADLNAKEVTGSEGKWLIDMMANRTEVYPAPAAVVATSTVEDAAWCFALAVANLIVASRNGVEEGAANVRIAAEALNVIRTLTLTPAGVTKH